MDLYVVVVNDPPQICFGQDREPFVGTKEAAENLRMQLSEDFISLNCKYSVFKLEGVEE